MCRAAGRMWANGDSHADRRSGRVRIKPYYAFASLYRPSLTAPRPALSGSYRPFLPSISSITTDFFLLGAVHDAVVEPKPLALRGPIGQSGPEPVLGRPGEAVRRRSSKAGSRGRDAGAAADGRRGRDAVAASGSSKTSALNPRGDRRKRFFFFLLPHVSAYFMSFQSLFTYLHTYHLSFLSFFF